MWFFPSHFYSFVFHLITIHFTSVSTKSIAVSTIVLKCFHIQKTVRCCLITNHTIGVTDLKERNDGLQRFPKFLIGEYPPHSEGRENSVTVRRIKVFGAVDADIKFREVAIIPWISGTSGKTTGTIRKSGYQINALGCYNFVFLIKQKQPAYAMSSKCTGVIQWCF